VTTPPLATTLRRIADLAEARGFSDEASRWRQLGRTAEEHDVRDETTLARIAADGASDVVRACLDAVVRRGADAIVEETRSALPWILRRLLELEHVDTRQVRWLGAQQILTVGELSHALTRAGVAGPLRGHAPGLKNGLDVLRLERLPVPLGRALSLLEGLLELIGTIAPTVVPFTIAGDVRRSEPLIDWFAVAAAAHDPGDVLGRIDTMPAIQPVRYRRDGRMMVTFGGVEVDVRVARPEAFGTVLHAATGSPTHVSAIGGCAGADPASDEDALYARAGLPWIAPELRHDTGEIEAARAGRLPHLIERAHIRGDLHVHTDYSDGRDPVIAMVQAAAALGYAYIAITDHSTRSFASRTLTLDSLARQRDEIAAARARFPSIEILHGVEVDIMPDGTLDFPDQVLEPFDIVLASLHDRAGHDGAALTRRCLGAIRHPLVNVITHPANRMVGRDTGYDLDFDTIFEAAAGTGTALEVDGAPGHLDLDGALARRAIGAGATLVVDSDCHRASLLERQMRLGIGTARRGWVEPRHVLNTRPVDEVRRFVARKRQG
jgi:DNA polymerase (family X)